MDNADAFVIWLVVAGIIVALFLIWWVDGCRLGVIPFLGRREMFWNPKPLDGQFPGALSPGLKTPSPTRTKMRAYHRDWIVYGPKPDKYVSDLYTTICLTPAGEYFRLLEHTRWKRMPPVGEPITALDAVSVLQFWHEPIETYERVFPCKATAHFHFYFTPNQVGLSMVRPSTLKDVKFPFIRRI